MDLTLSKAHQDIQHKAREFVDQVLVNYELECEVNDGLSRESLETINQAVMGWELNALNHSKENGGQGYSIFEQMLVDEQLGRVTGAIWDTVFRPSYPMKNATPAQKEEYLIPTCQGRRRDCYAITEADAGSDPTQCLTRADRIDGGYRINGEKWFVTVGDVADYILVHAHVDGDPANPAVFFVDKNLPGVELKRTPLYTHHFCYKHPEYIFNNVEVGADKLLGKEGQGYELTKDWFVEARLGIAARCIGGATRALEDANEFAANRIQFGQPIRNFQAIEFMLADMAVEIMAAKSMLYRVCAEIDAGQDRKLNHAKVAAVKLYCSEMVGRVCDKAVQILGGRGYMRENAVERLWRDTRVDRIWEGTSEIQRVIIGGQIKKRGLEIYTGW
ncbi:acyl-CoA dehydrogenase [Zobellella endophytica]|uniref:Medium-chain specific acyl-CoA dehydrogenase, mitochondrial n=1 Tax=Zobellella endophytica TaxID=2116700 RepID=A0A2P7QQU9_9GAMM|nr:acyl-CoA dehydrogenase family protein [Zobellella endophytica]PSJ40343.1 acyl-CoA dehydrogenase [Zobellella endophytica]